MTLHKLVRTVGGDLYAGGYRANVPAPGHSPEDRSISILLTEGRLVLHGFGGVDWRQARDWLLDLGFIDASGRLADRGGGPDRGLCHRTSAARPDRAARVAVAASLWTDGRPLRSVAVALRYLDRRAVVVADGLSNLCAHPRAPTSAYRRASPARPAVMARISDGQDRLTAVELTYLDPNGALASGVRLSRKTIGCVPAGAAVRLAPSDAEMLVAEGVVTTLSAMRRFGLPGWALGAAGNLALWTPPPDVRRVVIAADTGAPGLLAADRLQRRLTSAGIMASVRSPGATFSDWNAVDVLERDQSCGTGAGAG